MTDQEISLTPGEHTLGRKLNKRSENYGQLNQDVYTADDIADRLGMDREGILKQIRSKKLKAKFFGGPVGYRITHADLVAWLNATD